MILLFKYSDSNPPLQALSPTNAQSAGLNSEGNSQQKQQSRRRKSQGEREREDELNRSRRSSKSRLQEEDLPESYADLAKRVYQMAEKEGWSQQKVFELLKDPAKLVKAMEHVRYFAD